jgi:RNA polymerase sigma-70 factor, ECF subfamily
MDEYLRRVLINTLDQEAWERLYLKYYNFISAVLKKHIFNFEAHEDVRQEIWIRVYKNIRKYDPEYKFTTWLWREAKNTCIDWGKRNSRYFEQNDINRDTAERKILLLLYDDNYQEDANSNAYLLDFTDNLILHNAIYEALEKIENKEQVVFFLLHFVDGFSLEDTSRIMKLPATIIHNWVTRVPQKLQKYLSDFYEKKTKTN